MTWGPDEPRSAADAERVAQIRRALAAVDVRTHPAWRDAMDRFEKRGTRVGGPRNGFEEYPEITIAADRFSAHCTIEYWMDRGCHKVGAEDIELFDVVGRFQEGEPVIETISWDYDFKNAGGRPDE